MPSLDWIGKHNVINYHLKTPYCILERKYSYDTAGQHDEDNHSQNMIIHGDNLIALKSLQLQYEGAIKCIYIDPPYNTGEEKWVYNDNVNDEQINDWIGSVVGKEGEDLSRHDKWLCMMYPRLVMLHKLLHDDGVIFISIDDNEYANLKSICDEIFGPNNFVTTFIWEKRVNRENRKVVSSRHDYILCYAKNKKDDRRPLKQLPMSGEALARYSNPDNDPRGPWKSDPATAQAGHATQSQFYTLTTPGGVVHELPAGRCWLYTEEKMLQEIIEGRIWLGSNGTNTPRKKTYLNDKERGLTPETIWFAEDVSTNEKAKNELKSIFSDSELPFTTPKPHELIEMIIRLCTDENDIVLDSFAGSASTAHAVLNVNNKYGGNRKFILIEKMDYAEEITAERVKRIISGYKYKEDVILYDKKIDIEDLKNGNEILEQINEIRDREREKYDSISNPKIDEHGRLKVVAKSSSSTEIPGLEGDFSYYELGNELFTDDGFSKDVDIGEIRKYIYFTETKQLIDSNADDNEYFLGSYMGTAYYFYYDISHETVLDRDFLHTIKTPADAYVIYAGTCILNEYELTKHHITFRKISRDVKRI